MIKQILKKGWLCVSLIAAGAQAQSIEIFTPTNVWASVAHLVGGNQVKIITAVDSDNQDPHAFEASAANKLDVSNAKIVLINGGGYDDWAKQLVQSVNTQPILIDAVQVSGFDRLAENFNEHVFYSLETAKKVATKLNTELKAIDAAHADIYDANQAKFDEKLQSLKAEADTALAKDTHIKAIATEPVVGYLLQAMHIKDVTPEIYTKQSETSAGPSVKAMQETLNLLNSHQVQLLVLNAQTEDSASIQLERTAEKNNIAVVHVYETIVEGVDDYYAFIGQAIENIKKAVNP